jgi:hypothetical protein
MPADRATACAPSAIADDDLGVIQQAVQARKRAGEPRPVRTAAAALAARFIVNWAAQRSKVLSRGGRSTSACWRSVRKPMNVEKPPVRLARGQQPGLVPSTQDRPAKPETADCGLVARLTPT